MRCIESDDNFTCVHTKYTHTPTQLPVSFKHLAASMTRVFRRALSTLVVLSSSTPVSAFLHGAGPAAAAAAGSSGK
jgi:hypothetical protein